VTICASVTAKWESSETEDAWLAAVEEIEKAVAEESDDERLTLHRRHPPQGFMVAKWVGDRD